ncbi:MAG: helix-turn-helix domain-containing protein [Halobacteriales archaeon]|nr:helix-turn-helix domain-containing protein [Halobacteriales archaeon]
MSIDREQFESASETELSALSVPDQVLGFLATHDDRAFEASEIARRLNAETGAVSTALSRLKSRDLVEHKGTYWAVTTDESRLTEHDGYERATALFDDQLGEEDPEAWEDEAPDEPHPSVTSEQ